MSAPLVVLNNFSQSEESHVKLMKVTFQHMFPTINVKTILLRECRRVVLFHYNKYDGTVELRHYAIRANPVGVSRGVKRILQSRIPDLSKLEVGVVNIVVWLRYPLKCVIMRFFVCRMSVNLLK